jgi:hypothetical protein
MNSLQLRLASLRRWLRFVVTVRGLCWLLTLLLGAAALTGWLDWRIHLPSLVRAAVLTGTLDAMAYVAFRFLLRPLNAPADDLSLALRIEDLYPTLKDGLASTVQFLEQPEDVPPLDSPRLRQETVQRTLRQVEDLDFHGVVSTRGVPSAGLSLVAAGVLTFLLIFLYPAQAGTALVRLTNPFGGRDWPKQTQIEIRAPARVARGEPFEIQGLVYGVIPPQAVVEYEGGAPAKQVCPILPGKEPHTGTWMARRDRVERSFRFQVRANDAVSDWYEVAVLPPPVLVPLDGRVSPLVHLEYPAYTDLPPQDLPDGSGNIEAVAGTCVTWRAATDRPVARAWIEYRPEQPRVIAAAVLGTLGTNHPAGLLALTASGQTVWDRMPLQIDSTGRVLSLEFRPRVSGLYALRLEDESGLGNTRLFDLRIFPDPEPTVTLERPSLTNDSLEVLPGAEITLQAAVDDPQFAVRSVFLEYRCRKNDPPRRLPLYDHAAVGTAVPQLLCALAGQPLPVPALRLRPQHLQIARRLTLGQFKHRDGSGLKEGDVLTLQVGADDFDDISVGKKPGRSHEVELRIVNRSALEILLSKAQGQVQQDLVRLRKWQREALQKVIGPEQQWRNTGKLRDQDVEQLFQAEQIQQQIRARIGTAQEGLQAEVARILRTLKDNRLPRSGTHDRMETVAAELERLAREDLEQIEPNLTRARKEKEAAGPGKKPSEGQQGPLNEARRHQEEVENTLGDLLKLLEPWGSINEIKGDAKSILQEQRKLSGETKNLDKEDTRGKKPEELTAEQKAQLDRAAQWQSKLAERAADLLGKMDRIGADRQEKDAALAEALKAAADQGREDGLGEQMKEAGAKIGKNQLGDAGQAQQQAMDSMGKMVQALEERREEELDRLRKQLKEAQDKLADLTQRQEQLRKKIKQAEQLTDPVQRREELKRLAREQEKLQKEAQEMLRELTRLRTDRAKQALGEASERMAEIGRQLGQQEATEESQEETLDRLNEARRELKREQEEVEEQLAREKLAKVADEIKRLKERQDAAGTEGARIDREVLQRKEWDRGLLRSLNDLSGTQKDLGEETEALAKGKLAGAPVFARILTRSAAAMKQAGERMRNRFEQVRDNPETIDPDAEAPRHQAEAARRLKQLLDALQPEKGLAQRSPPQGEGQPGGSARGRPGDEGLSVLAQLKGVRLLQQELNEKTEAFARGHPDPAKLTPAAQRELEGLHQEQRELMDLFEELTKPGDTEGGDK